MNDECTAQYSGFLLEVTDPFSSSADFDFSNFDSVSRIDRNANLWEHYCFKTVKPLLHEEISMRDGMFSYRLLCRRSRSRFILLAESRGIVSEFINTQLNKHYRTHYRKVDIGIQKLILDYLHAENDSEYTLCQAYARVVEFKNALDSLSFYGNDLAASAIFNDCALHKNIEFHACGLRLRTTRTETLRVNSYGGISFPQIGDDGLRNGLKALNYLSRTGYTGKINSSI